MTAAGSFKRLKSLNWDLSWWLSTMRPPNARCASTWARWRTHLNYLGKNNMATFILHNQDVWNLTDLKFSERLVLNYLWAWKSRGNAITVSNTFLGNFYNIPSMDVAQILQTLQSKRYIDITQYVSAGRVIDCLPLKGQAPEMPDDIFDHLY